MKKIFVGLEKRSYSVIVESGILSRIASVLPSFEKFSQAVMITDDQVWELHGKECFRKLQACKPGINHIVVPHGERRKSFSWAQKIYNMMLDFGCDRKTCIIALGGGVIGDLSGFVAATFMRGIPFYQVPTTLLAQVDASIGGKVGVNLPKGKNLVGAFYQPLAVIIDPSVLKTLSSRHMKGGMAEVIKYGLISKDGFFDYLKDHMRDIYAFTNKDLEKAIHHSCQIKADVVSKDEKEAGLRAILNFGHTIGHAIEACEKYNKVTHGEGVAIGMAGAARLSWKKGLISFDDVIRIEQLIRKAKLPIKYPWMHIPDILEKMKVDKKREKGAVRFVLLEEIGKTVITDDVPEKMVVEVLAELKNEE